LIQSVDRPSLLASTVSQEVDQTLAPGEARLYKIMEFSILTPSGFSFKRTVLSHGWYNLPPFDLDREQWILSRVLNVGSAQPITVRISSGKGLVKATASRALGKRAAEQVKRDVRHMLRLDDEMSSFYAAVAHDPEFDWVASSGAGRLLRSPTVFEDLVKTMCTTNCSWALTYKMVGGLVGELGRESRVGQRAFPSPEAMASKPERFYRDVIRAGYRAPYLKELAERVASGSLDVESWASSDLSTPELQREMKTVKGVGDYAAENLLKLLGRYDCLALDSWVRGKFKRTRNGGRKTSDKKIEKYYSRFGEWRGLALWCDLTRDWLESEESAARP
jgi:3-methyladenine DNA glycosylase/8-oxoguanine DNA glycosylase